MQKQKKNTPNSKKGMVAWLVTWETTGDYVRTDKGEVAAVLNPRSGDDTVREMLEFIYVNEELDLHGRLEYAKSKTTLYRAEAAKNGFICGHNLFLRARLVENLRVVEDENGQEIPVWEERKPRRRLATKSLKQLKREQEFWSQVKKL
jgi:hypothetical protein